MLGVLIAAVVYAGSACKIEERGLVMDVDVDVAQKICCENRRYAERRGYHKVAGFDTLVTDGQVFYDSACGVPVFKAAVGRTLAEWRDEMAAHGWPSFRDAELISENVVINEDLHNEVASSCGTHLGHNIPDEKGNRYCINLVCMAGKPAQEEPEL
eukprot:TRINITY_DN9310_c0_g2_i1.p2 TRINITY_DN9310_c0_g2~~TRINITY_DN9310_c0_g2_i1.p2  ORF type:complete len:156 (+),score=40.85 TRINITY_DN9310_c0_g2_i1:45-512(+)